MTRHSLFNSLLNVFRLFFGIKTRHYRIDGSNLKHVGKDALGHDIYKYQFLVTKMDHRKLEPKMNGNTIDTKELYDSVFDKQKAYLRPSTKELNAALDKNPKNDF